MKMPSMNIWGCCVHTSWGYRHGLIGWILMLTAPRLELSLLVCHLLTTGISHFSQISLTIQISVVLIESYQEINGLCRQIVCIIEANLKVVHL